MAEPAPLLVFSDDWGRHPSSCQHLINHILPHRAVTWVNTIGTRPPRLDWNTLTRGLGKLKSWLFQRAERQSITGPDVLNPTMWPSFRSRIARGLNRQLLLRSIHPVVEAMPAPPVVITTLPLVADLVGRFRAARWVYYCVDDFSTWPGLDGRTMQSMEAELVPKMDVVIAVSTTLQEHLAKFHKSVHILTHGVDLNFWRAPVIHLPPSLRDVPALPPPLIVYWGVIDLRTDLAFVQALANILTEGTILFAGPRDHPNPTLLRLPHVRTLPPIPFEDLPALASMANVLIAPYADLPVTRAMQPLKLKEYLATGKPVVVRKIPAAAEWSDCADVVESPEAFAQAVLLRITEGVSQSQVEARKRLEAERWDLKAMQFESFADGGPRRSMPIMRN